MSHHRRSSYHHYSGPLQVSPHAVRVEECRTMLSVECTPAAQRSAVRTRCVHGRCDSGQRDLRCLFQRTKEAGLLLNKDKCVLGRSSIKFLGHIVDSQGISIPPDRVDDIKLFPRAKTPKELESFLGICAFFHRFVPHASGKMASLTRLKNISCQKEFDGALLP